MIPSCRLRYIFDGYLSRVYVLAQCTGRVAVSRIFKAGQAF